VHVMEIVEMDDEELYIPDDVLEDASAARYLMLPKKSKYVIRKNWKIYERVKDSERKAMSEPEMNERETFTFTHFLERYQTKDVLISIAGVTDLLRGRSILLEPHVLSSV
jgi:hypothetical protein